MKITDDKTRTFRTFILRLATTLIMTLLFMGLTIKPLAAPSPAMSKNNLASRNYISTEGKTYTNIPDGKPKILTFINGSGGCFLSNSFVQNLQGLNLDKVDVMVVDVFAANIEPVKRYKADYGKDNKDVIFACSQTAQAGWDILEYSLNILGNSNPKFPIVFYINKDNTIVAATHGDYSKETLKDNCKKYFGIDISPKSDSALKAVTKVSTPVAGKGSFKYSFTPVKGYKNYQIAYSLKKNFPSGSTKKVTMTLSGNRATASKTIKGLSSNKTYYVKVRTYKTVNGKRQYSAWSKVKSVKTK